MLPAGVFSHHHRHIVISFIGKYAWEILRGVQTVPGSLEVISTNFYIQWLKWSCEAGGGGGSPDEARLKQTPYPF